MDPSSSSSGGIEQNLRLLARTGLALFLALTATLFVVQLVLGRQMQDLSHNALEGQRALNAVESALGALFRRQAQILSTTAAAQLKPVADRTALEARLREAGAFFGTMRPGTTQPGAGEAVLRGQIDKVLQADHELYGSIAHRHELQSTFDSQLASVNQQLRAVIEQTNGVLGYAHLDYVLLLRRLNTTPGDAALVRDLVMGDRRAQQELASDLTGQMLTLGVVVGRIGLAPTSDVVNSIMANEIGQNVSATNDKLEQLAALVAGGAAELAARVQALRKTYAAAIENISAEHNATSMVALRRAWFKQQKRADELREISMVTAQQLTANMAQVQSRVLADGEHAVARADRTIWLTRGLSLLLLTGGLGICVFAARRIRTSVAELRESNRTLGDLKERLVAVNSNLEGLVAARTEALGARERAMRLILDNTGDGLIATGLDGAIKGDVSYAARHWIGEPAAAQPVWEYLFPDDPPRQQFFKVSFCEMVEEVLPFEVYAGQMPPRIERAGRIMSLACKPIREVEALVGVLVTLQDVTAQLEAERREEEARELQMMVGQILRSPQGFRTFLEEGDHLMELLDGAADLVVVKRVIHTLKGNCSIYGFRSLALLCHAVEDDLEDSGAFSAEDAQRLRAAWQVSLAKVSQFISHGNDRVELQPRDVASLKEMLSGRAAHDSILQMVETWAFEPVQSILERLAAQAKRIASSLGREIEVSIEHDMLRLPDRFAPFWASLVHVVRNAVDHGVERAEDREAQGKGRVGHIGVRARQRADRTLDIEVTDDGAGLDFARLAERARQMGLPHASEREILDAVFADGLSTRETVTELSGRGVGLGAVRAACEQLGGRVRIRSKAAVGTSFTFTFPAAALNGKADLAPAPVPLSVSGPVARAGEPPAVMRAVGQASVADKPA